MKISNILSIAGLAALALTSASCKKDFLNNYPTSQVETGELFKTTQGARAAVNGIHSIMFETTADHNSFGYPSIALMSDLMGGDMGMNRTGSGWFVTAFWYRDVAPDNTGAYMWGFYYDIINNANHIITKIDNATGPQSDKQEIRAQALTYRAWAYFQLMTYYQFPYANGAFVVGESGSRLGVIDPDASRSEALGVPIYTEPTQIAKPRATLEEVYTQITNDLDAAIRSFDSASIVRTDKSQINVDVAKGIYARVALTKRDWTKAANMARDARQGYTLMNKSELVGGFNRIYTPEWIWGSEINAEQSGIYASFISQMDNELPGSYASQQTRVISQSFFDSVSFDVQAIKRMPADDYRRGWATKDSILRVGRMRYFYPQRKFRAQKANTFVADFPLMRASEMYLIEAEAKAQSGDLGGATTVLQEFGISRSPSYSTAGLTSRNLIVQEVWRQRRFELWGEGFAFTDAKRNMAPFVNGVTAVTGIFYGFGRYLQVAERPTIQPGSALLIFKIPGSELNQNPGFIQNPTN